MARRVRHLLALDARNVMTRLAARQDEMVRLYSRLRDRGPLIDVVHSWFPTVSFGELALLTPEEQLAVSDFHEVLDELRWYVRYTEDMPLKVKHTVEAINRRLEERYHALIAVIGPADARGGPVVDGRAGRAGRG